MWGALNAWLKLLLIHTYIHSHTALTGISRILVSPWIPAVDPCLCWSYTAWSEIRYYVQKTI